MKLHRNAKSTPSSRLLLVRRVLFEGWSYAAAAKAAGVSERTVAKWVTPLPSRRGVAALEDALVPAGRAAPSDAAVGGDADPVVARAAWVAGVGDWPRACGIPRSTVSAWLRRLGLNRPPVAPPVPMQRYEWPRPGDMIHVDIKPLGRIGCVGHRIHGDRRRRAAGRRAGSTCTWPSTITAGRVCRGPARTSSAPPAPRFSSAPSPGSGARGIRRPPRPERQRQWLRVAASFARPATACTSAIGAPGAYTPRTNGKAERFIQTLLREWAYVVPYATSHERRLNLRPYLRFYNRQRPHAES